MHSLYKLLTVFFLIITNFVFAQDWGAIYIDMNTGIAGGSSNTKSNLIANRLANESCVEKHEKKGLKHKCEYMGSFYNGCNAVYWSSNKKAGWNYAFDPNDAKRSAYNLCIKAGGKDCQLSLGFCTDRIMY